MKIIYQAIKSSHKRISRKTWWLLWNKYSAFFIFRKYNAVQNSISHWSNVNAMSPKYIDNHFDVKRRLIIIYFSLLWFSLIELWQPKWFATKLDELHLITTETFMANNDVSLSTNFYYIATLDNSYVKKNSVSLG